jgi:hypothetical protein
VIGILRESCVYFNLSLIASIFIICIVIIPLQISCSGGKLHLADGDILVSA